MSAEQFLKNHPQIESDFYEFLATIFEEYGKLIFEKNKGGGNEGLLPVSKQAVFNGECN